MNTEAHIMQAEGLGALLASEKNSVSAAAFTVQSLITGKDFTYKIYRKEFNGHFYTHILVENGYLEFKRLGTYQNGHILNKQHNVVTPSALAIRWVLNKIQEQKFSLLAEKVKIFHLGKCLKCGKTLTDATSIEYGLGPICRSF